ncbi:glycosyl hydrolase family 18 protein [uncultured Alistipes sp.]|uniref:BT_3987 domain-containing protein n=1 Tax=uncultured Alistipes sp. TaxID=538949 RepID=UPI00258A12A6|nr:glycosyl hydrolase family 18 protein [uncultured Alistipes sp.]
MKTNYIQSLFAAFLCAAACAGFTACESDTIETSGGKKPDQEALQNVYGKLRSGATAGNTVSVLLAEGEGSGISTFYFQQTKPAADAVTLAARGDASLADAYNEAEEVERTVLPAQNYEFPDGASLDLSKDTQRSAYKRIRFLASGLTPGEYVLPLTVAEEGMPDDAKTLYYNITVRQPQIGDTELHKGDDLFFVFYINTDQYQPLLVDEYFMQKEVQKEQYGGQSWYNLIGNIINLRTVRLDREAESGRAILSLGDDMTYVLGQAVKYIRPLQDKGRKVCISIEGAGSGLGFCNLTDAQIADFTAQVKTVIDSYQLDGINLWDRNSGYGKEGMPAMNTTSYPKLIKSLREALGTEKLLTVTVYDRPTETFHDVDACGGIAVGDYIDYAWSGYNSNKEAPQLLDPWHPTETYVSAYTQKPIANLPAERFGCINFPFYPEAESEEEAMMQDPAEVLSEWVETEYKPNNIMVFADLRTNLQDGYEGIWDGAFSTYCDCMDINSRTYQGRRNGLSYNFDLNRGLGNYPEKGGYGKWLKDWK